MQVFSCEIFERFNKIYFEEHLQAIASTNNQYLKARGVARGGGGGGGGGAEERAYVRDIYWVIYLGAYIQGGLRYWGHINEILWHFAF